MALWQSAPSASFRTLGRWPLLTLARARKLVRDAQPALALGRDPAQGAEQGAGGTLADLVTAYLNASPAGPWHRELARTFRHDLAIPLGARSAEMIRRGEIVVVLDAIRARGAPTSARRAWKCLRQVYRWALEREIVTRDPTAGIRPPDREESRSRVLTPDELRRLVSALDAYRGAAALALALQLYTAQRGGELVRARVEDVDGEWLTIPRERTKAKRDDHPVYLTASARRILALSEPARGFLFPSDDGIGPLRQTSLVRAMSVCTRRAGIPDARPHDLRRTAATLMVEAGVSEAVVAVVLGHATRLAPRVTSVYVRYRYEPERRAALVALESKLLTILGAGSEPPLDLDREPPNPPT